MKVCTVLGARPQFIKAATVSRIILDTEGIEERIVHTGQHYDANMSQQFFDELHIPNPHIHLNIGSASHGKQTGQMLEAIEVYLLEEKPDIVLVYGDTNSTLAGALAAAKLHIPVAHVEAGLRSFNRRMPEELNRITTDHLSTYLFPPTDFAYQRLLTEGLLADSIMQVGDVMYDATLFYNQQNAGRTSIVDDRNLSGSSYVLATIHRAENTDVIDRLRHILDALIELSQEIKVVLPLHPRTYHLLEQHGLLNTLSAAVDVIDPVGYLDMLALEKHASWIVTDSGGVQKEAYFNRVPCVTLRDETEWVELVNSGWNTLCSPEKSFSLLQHISSKHDHSLAYPFFYGEGDAAQKIVNRLLTA